MKKLTFLCLLILSTILQAKEWHQEKGTLHKATMKEWCQSDVKNKLATAGDFVAVGYQDKMLKTEITQAIDSYGMSGIKVMAEEIIESLDTAACNGKKVDPDLATIEVADMAMMSMMIMGWTKE